MSANERAVAERVRSKHQSAVNLASSRRFDQALTAVDEILRTYDRSATPEVEVEIASVLYTKGVILRELKQPERALAVWSDTAGRFGAHRDRNIFYCVTRAAFNHASCLRSLGRTPESLQGFERVMARAATVAEPEALEMFGLAALNQAYLLAELGRHEEALASFDRVIEPLARQTDPSFLFMLTTARGNKADSLVALGRREEALSVQMDTLRSLEGRSEPELIEPAAIALFNAGAGLGELDRHLDSIAAYDRVIATYSRHREPAIRQQVTKALLNRAVMLGKLGRDAEAVCAYAEVVRWAGASDDAVLFECVGRALHNWTVVLARMGRSDEVADVDALTTRLNRELDEIRTRGQVVSALRQHALASAPAERAELFDAVVQDALAAKPGSDDIAARALIDKGAALASAERLAEAVEQWQQVVELLGDRCDHAAWVLIAIALDSIGVAHMRQERFAEAAATFSSLLQRFPSLVNVDVDLYRLRAEHALDQIHRRASHPPLTMSSLRSVAALRASPEQEGLPAHHVHAELQLRPPVLQLEYAACDPAKNAQRMTGTALVLGLMKHIQTEQGVHFEPPEIMFCFPMTADGPHISDPEHGAKVVRISFGAPPARGAESCDANYDLLVEALATFGLPAEHALACTHFAGIAELLGYDNENFGFYPGRAALCRYLPRSERK